MLETGIQLSALSPGRDVSNLHVRAVSAQRMIGARSAIAREMEALWMSTIDIPRHAVAHMLPLAEQQESTWEADESNEAVVSVVVVGSETAKSIRGELECVTEERDVVAITGTSMMMK